MATRVRTVDFLPEIFQTSTNKQFLAATLDQLVQEPKFKKTQGYVGRRVGPGVNADDKYVLEATKSRTDYQLEPGVILLDPDNTAKIQDAITYPGISDALALQGAITNKSDRLYTSEYYSWDPFVDFDKLVNFSQYYWLPFGPQPVDVFANETSLTNDYTVTRENGVYTFNGLIGGQVPGDDPALTLVRGGSYTFQVAQNTKETVNYRVTNLNQSAYVIDYISNPALTLARGNTYVFNLSLSGIYPFWIKTVPTQGKTDTYSNGVTNNGATAGLITFTVPQDAPNTLYYASENEFNMQGVLNIIDGTPGTGPGFWIQAEPGVSGTLPYSPNISSRTVLGVADNGTDLGTVTFDVPLSTAQSYYYSLTPINTTIGGQTGVVNLATELEFNQINNQFVLPFIQQYGGIDDITNLNGSTLVFLNSTNQGWEINSQFDPLPIGSADTGITGSFDTLLFDQTTPITDQNIRYSVWQIQYVTADGSPVDYTDLSNAYMKLVSITPIQNEQKFTVLGGTQYANTQWFKTTSGYINPIPLLTAIKSVLYYQDGTDPEIVGQIRLIDPSGATTLDVYDIIGKKNYTSPNGVVFTNGLKVQFRGDVFPDSYTNNQYYVEGVGTAIKLMPVADFVTPETYTKDATIPFDTVGFDSGTFDAFVNQPVTIDYLTINRGSSDYNAWSRSNRWFHIDVINASAAYNNIVPSPDNAYRGKRPILEFRAGLRLYEMGTEAKQPVNIIDFTTTDAFSNVNGTTGYSVDGYQFIQGTRVIFAKDTDPTVRNKVYDVNFIDTNGGTQVINLTLATDATPLVDQNVVCLNGNTLQGVSFYYDGVEWLTAQQKTSVNQAPLFDLYDYDGISFANKAKYSSSTFAGCKLFSYAVGSGVADTILGFPLRYLSLSNVGDIVFDNNLYIDTFVYVSNKTSSTANVSLGFARQYVDRTVFSREIGWQTAITPSLTRQQFQFTYDGTPLQLDVKVLTNNLVPSVLLYVGSQFQSPSTYTITTTDTTTKIVLNNTYPIGSIIEVDVLSDQTSTNGFYQVPINLENNPFNDNSGYFTLGTVRSHYETIGENLLLLQGTINGANNSRDLGNIIPYGLQILQQSSPLTMSGFFMRDQQYDIFKSLAFNDREYIKFKSKMLETVVNNEWGNSTVPEILDAVITELAVGKTSSNSFYWSDMLPAGSASTTNKYTVTPITTQIFDTIQTYDFTSANYLGLLVYKNDRLLMINTEYVVTVDAPKLTILVPLAVGDVITITEYANTAGNFVPNTPTKLGLYQAYRPRIFLDTNYVNPVPVIQGHDGSITVAFQDIRDQILLEYELRVYNNLKTQGNPVPLSIADVMPGYFRKTDYSTAEINSILAESFLTWVGWNKLDYKAQTYDAGNPFTYNYSQAGDKLKNEPLLGAWRGISRYFYDTLSPNYTPWEMVGFSEKPDWWETQYGPAPYTADNLVLWDDMAAGLVADPNGSYVRPEYIRPNLSYYIPTGTEGQLLSPLESVVGNYDPNVWRKSWVVGDGGPVEASWWESSSYPFAVMRLLALTRPAEFFSLFADRDLYRYVSDLKQYLYEGRYRLNANGIQVYGNGVSKASYVNWIVDYNQQLGINSTTALETDLANLDVRLCYRMASFTDKQYLKVYTERSSPNSLNSSLLLPDESYNLLLYKNTPFSYVNYSAVLVQIAENGGYTLIGYSISDPYFEILASRSAGQLQTISAGGTTVQVPKQYYKNVVQVPYGFTFTNQAAVVDFLLSYGQLLQDRGITFTNRENGYTLNWTQMAREFLYWANQGWQVGSVINLNPCADRLTASKPLAVVDNIAASTPENLLIDQNRLPIDARNLVIERLGNDFNVTSTTSSAISYVKLKFTSYEHIMIPDNVSIFADLIYNPVTGARQNRLNIVAATSTEWNGTLDAQGFILNEDNVKKWQPNLRYPKGEIVLYKNNYWSAQNIVQPKVEFNYNDWVKSDYTKIQRGLLPNIANKADQLANSYNVQKANLESDNDLLSYGLIGFRPRQYMAALNLDDVSQVNIYQDFLGSKGTIKAAELFTGANLGKEIAQYDIYENWAIKRGTYGANANNSFYELRLNEALLNSDPATIQVILPGETSIANQSILLSNLWRQSYKITSPEILPTTYIAPSDIALPSAGYVNIDDVDVTVFSIDDPTSISQDINNIGIGTKIWVAKTNNYDWNVYRTNKTPGYISQVSDNLDGTSQVTFTQPHGLSRGDLLIIRYFNSAINGVYRVLTINTSSPNLLNIAYDFGTSKQTLATGQGIGFFLQTMRVSQASDIINLPYVNDLVPGAMAWCDNNGSGHWEVLEKQSPFKLSSQIITGPVTLNTNFGASVAQAYNNIGAVIGAPGYNNGRGSVYSYYGNKSLQYTAAGLIELNAVDTVGYGNSIDFGHAQWVVAGASESYSQTGYATVIEYDQLNSSYSTTQMMLPPDENFDSGEFGKSVTISQDEHWMYIGAPGTNTVYAYGRVDVPDQTITYTVNNNVSYNYSDYIQIRQTPSIGYEQIVVKINNTTQIYGVDYIMDANNITFLYSPPLQQTLTISRRLDYTFTGTGSATVFALKPVLYTATNIDSFIVKINGVIQRPYIDYTLNLSNYNLIFTTAPALDSSIDVMAGTYWQYIDYITVDVITSTARFGESIKTSTDGRILVVGAPLDEVNSMVIGSTYIFDRGVSSYIVTDASQLQYAIPLGFIQPVAVLLNNQYLTNTSQYVNGNFTVVDNSIILSANVTLQVGDTITIENNIFGLVQKININKVFDDAAYGQAVDLCVNNCSLYVGAPLDGSVTAQAGSVERRVNQARVYGVITSTVANPTLNTGDTLNINNFQVTVPSAPNNTVAGLANTINNSNLPNVAAKPTANLELFGDGTTKVFDIGTIYSAASSYTTVVYSGTITNPLQTLLSAGPDYNYNNSTQQITFTLAPANNSVITVVSGRLTISVKNYDAATPFNRLSLLPGITGTAFGDLGFDLYAYTQTITSPNPLPYAKFGSALSISTTANTLVAGAPYGNIYEPVTFDAGETYFDEHSTVFSTTVVESGAVYTYDYLPSANDSISNPGKFAFGQQIYDSSIMPLDQFGSAINYTTGRLLLGLPGDDPGSDPVNYGSAVTFTNENNTPAWTIKHAQQPVVDVALINSVYMYDKLLNTVTSYLDFFNPLQGKILGVARQDIDYIGAVDPANYNNGSIHNIGSPWGQEHVGEIWWDTNLVRFIDPNQDDIVYASRRWGQVFPGSRIDIYQWIESTSTPTNYIGPGTPLSTISYTSRAIVSTTGLVTTFYYFWVRNISTVNTVAGKKLSTSAIASYIANPRASGIAYMAPLNSSTVAIYNVLDLISAQDTILHIEYDREANDDNVHIEYELIAQDKADSFLSTNLYLKLQDSFCGVNSNGAAVPDPNLSPAEKYGVEFRPRQSMFADRFVALQNYLVHANNVLANYPVVETRKFNLLNSKEQEPNSASGAWNKRVADLTELGYQDITAVPLGYKYLVASDSTNNGFWTIYEVETAFSTQIRELVLIRVQSYDTARYWSTIDWYLPGYNSTIKPVAEVPVYAGLATLTVPVGASVKVTANAQGKFEIYQRTLTGWDRVGLQDGTIAFSEELWNYSVGRFGFDAEVFDAQYFDQEPVTETRKIIQAINQELFVDDLLLERNRALILVFNFVLSEFTAPDWLIKTSLIDVNHKIRELIPYQVYRQDNQDFVLNYIQEVKPYHVQIKEFSLTYNGNDTYPGSMTDFDVPAYYDTSLALPKYVSPILLPYDKSTASGYGAPSSVADTPASSLIWTEIPWVDWYNNYLLSVQSIDVSNNGTGYSIAPTVTISAPDSSVGVQATATAYVNSKGQIVEIIVDNPGSGYSTTPTITLTGVGTGAIVYPVMANGLVRSIKTIIKYDRYQYQTTIVDWNANVNYPQGTQVRYIDQVWQAIDTVSSSEFNPAQWTRVDPNTLSGVDRTMGLYVPTVNQPGLELPLLIDGVDYPGVQVKAFDFSVGPGFDTSGFDQWPYNNISYGAEGFPTYDTGLLDTIYESNYLDLYLGTRTTDINVDGGAYVDTYSSHAPEELIPGAEFDTLDMRVYTTPGADWARDGHGFLVNVRKFTSEISTPILDFSDVVKYPAKIIVTNQTSGLELNPGINYTVDWVNKLVTITSGSNIGDTLVINAYELGGGNQIFKQKYNGLELKNNPVLPIEYDLIQQLIVFINGEQTLFFSYQPEGTNQTKINIGNPLTSADYVLITAISTTTVDNTSINYSWSTPVTQYIVGTGSLSYTLTNSLAYNNQDNAVITVNGLRARSSAGAEYIADGSTGYALPDRLGFSQALIADIDVRVYINDVAQLLNINFTVEPYDGVTAREVLFNVAPANGSRVEIFVTTGAQAYIANGNLNFNPTGGLIPIAGDTIAVTTWNDTRQQNVLTQVYVGPVDVDVPITVGFDEVEFDSGPFNYTVGELVAYNNLFVNHGYQNPDRLWVTLNGYRLFPNIDFTVAGNEIVLASGTLSATDVVVISQFTNSIVPEAMAFRIFQDMRGLQAAYRITPKTTTYLTQQLLASDDTIHVADATALMAPDVENNIWGVLTINGERIMYRNRDTVANTISSLLRGTGGTAAATHAKNAVVYDMGRDNLMPAADQNYIKQTSVIADGTQTDFTSDIYLESISNNFVEVYVGGYKISTDNSQPFYYYVLNTNPVEVVFNVAPTIGLEVTVLVRFGVTWYQQGISTASNGVALQDTQTEAARFLKGQ